MLRSPDKSTFGNICIIICFDCYVMIVQNDVFVKFWWAIPFIGIERNIIANYKENMYYNWKILTSNLRSIIRY